MRSLGRNPRVYACLALWPALGARETEILEAFDADASSATVSSDKPSPVPEFPMKVWSVRVFILDQDGNEHEAKAFNKVTYNLHPSFENPNQSMSTRLLPSPFRLYIDPSVLTHRLRCSLPRPPLYLPE